MKPLRTLLASIVTACGLVLLAPAPPASACSCASGAQAVELHTELADTVFVGTFTRLPEDYSAGSVDYAFGVEWVYKGQVGPDVQVTSASSGAACGLEGMEAGLTYLVFAENTRRQGRLGASLCGGSQPVTPELRDRVEALLGSGSAPAQATGSTDSVAGGATPPNRAVFYGLLGLSAVVLTAMAWAMSPRRRTASRSDAALS